MRDLGRSSLDVALPRHIVTGVEERLPRTEFDSADAYIAYAMEEILAHVDGTDEQATEIDQGQVEARLESLGYLE